MSTMGQVDHSYGAGMLLSLLVAAGCSGGIPGASTSATFGPFEPTATMTDSTTTNAVDPTTGGLGDSEGRDSSGRPPEDTSGGVDSTATGDTDPGPDTTSTSGPTTSSDGPDPVCGDDMVDPGEDCDGTDLGGLDCAGVDAMFSGGVLACDGSCSFDTSGCSALTNPIVECVVVNGAIPDADPVGLTSTIMLPAGAQGLTITDVDVEVELDHTYLGDLVIDVTHSGTSVVLHDSCLSEENINVTYDDEAGAAFDCAQSDLGLDVQPLGTLSTLDGVATTASWTLFIEDQVGADTGMLQQWCVTIGWM